MTEADWEEAMRLFLEERWSDARIARKFNLSPSTVAAQRFKRGVYRDMRAEPPRLPDIDRPTPEALPDPPLLRPAQVAPEGDLARARALWADGVPERFDRLAVAVDPPAGMHGAACGVVTAARSGGRAWVLADDTVAGLSPLGWAQRVAAAVERAAPRGPVEVVAEANQGGEMVRTVLKTAGVAAPVRLVHASAGKAARAEPVALLYEQGRVAHAPGLGACEDQMLLLGVGAEGTRGASPDRADAAVWALTALMLGKERGEGPRVRVL